MDCFVIFYLADEEVERKVVIGSMALDALQDTIETNKDGPQSMQEGMATQTRKLKRGKKVDTSRAPRNVITNDAICTSTTMDVNKSSPSCNKFQLWFNNLQGLFHCQFKCCWKTPLSSD